MIKIHILQTGTVSVDIGVPIRQKNPLAKTGWFRSAQKRVTLPVTAYLIEHPKGLVLIDTGWDMAQRTTTVKRKFGLLPISFGNLPNGKAINEQINSLGFKTSDIDYVFLTHMDIDHAGGLALVQNAKQIMTSAEELADSKNPLYFYRYHQKNWQDIPIHPFEYKKTDMGPFGKSFDVFDDGSLVLVSTFGHSHGLSSAVVKGKEGFVVICGDTGYMRKSWEEFVLPGLTVDKSAALKSLKWLNAVSKDKNCIEILATHDPDKKPHIIELEEIDYDRT